jgi:hypothetical protein
MKKPNEEKNGSNLTGDRFQKRSSPSSPTLTKRKFNRRRAPLHFRVPRDAFRDDAPPDQAHVRGYHRACQGCHCRGVVHQEYPPQTKAGVFLPGCGWRCFTTDSDTLREQLINSLAQALRGVRQRVPLEALVLHVLLPRGEQGVGVGTRGRAGAWRTRWGRRRR